jgi:hypothetical protein
MQVEHAEVEVDQVKEEIIPCFGNTKGGATPQRLAMLLSQAILTAGGRRVSFTGEKRLI